MNNCNCNCSSALCNLVKSDYQYASKVLFGFIPNKIFWNLLNISQHVLTMINKISTEFFVEVCFTYQSREALGIEDNVSLTLILG